MTNNNIEFQINEIVECLGEKLRDVDKKEVLELVNYNESQIAMEVLCTQIYEFETKLTSDEYNKIKFLNEKLNLQPKFNEILKDLII